MGSSWVLVWGVFGFHLVFILGFICVLFVFILVSIWFLFGVYLAFIFGLIWVLCGFCGGFYLGYIWVRFLGFDSDAVWSPFCVLFGFDLGFMLFLFGC